MSYLNGFPRRQNRCYRRWIWWWSSRAAGRWNWIAGALELFAWVVFESLRLVVGNIRAPTQLAVRSAFGPTNLIDLRQKPIAGKRLSETVAAAAAAVAADHFCLASLNCRNSPAILRPFSAVLSSLTPVAVLYDCYFSRYESP